MSGVDIKKGDIGANVTGSADSTSAILFTGVEISGKVEYGKSYLVSNLKMAEELGIVTSYDTTNKVRIHHHISEFFRMAGDEKKLHIMIAPQDKTLVDLLTDKVYAEKLVNEADGEIRQLALSLNPASDYTDTSVDGINADVRAAIAKAQLFAENCYNRFRPLQVIIEGRGYGGDAGTAIDLCKIPDTPAPKVSVVIGQDWTFAESQDTVGKKYAAVGTALGCVAQVLVSKNIGENETMNITNAGVNVFLVGGLSDHSKIKDVEHTWSMLDSKHYLFPVREIGLSGLRWNNDHTCVEAKIDADGNINEHSISLGRVLDKAARLLRAQLLPKVKTTQPVDAGTGQLPVGVVKYFEGLGNDAFEVMKANKELTEGKTTVNPKSNLLSGDKALEASFVAVPYGTINKIKGVINLKNKI
ncbi:MAG: energy transducer TonB [Bacteroidales bacterium]|jgi:hypothetical protein|nr:energy transducer TonB [Bacteroidales bacterium]